MTGPDAAGEGRGPRSHVVVAPPWRDELDAMRLFEDDRLDRLLADATPAPGGRGGARIATLPASGRRILVRPFAHGGLLRAFTGARLLGPSRPLDELRVTSALRARGAPVPEPVFAVATRRGAFFRAAVATAFEPDARSAGDVARGAPDARALRGVARAAGRGLRAFHDAGGRHADLHVDNLLVVEPEDGPVRVVVVDLDRARVGPGVEPRRRATELVRLHRSCRKRAPDAADARTCAAFLSAYAAGDRRLRADLLAHARIARAHAALHALAYRRAPRGATHDARRPGQWNVRK